MQNDLISIVIPVYNDVKFLEKCVNSIMEQSYKNLEIIFVDDESTDGSSKLLDCFALRDERITVIHKKNAGVSAARNDGIEKASGKYICFSDADDILSKDYVQYLYDLLVRNDADISLTRSMFSNYDTTQVTSKNERIISGNEATIQILSYRIPIGVYCKLFKADVLRRKSIRFRENLFIGEGFNFNVDAFQRVSKVAVSDKKIYYYRRNNSTSATTSFSAEKSINGLKAIDVIRDNLLLKNDDVLKALNYAYWRTNSDVFDSIVLAKAQKEHIELYKRVKHFVRRYALSAFQAPVSKQDKIRAIIMMFCPNLIPVLMKLRNKKHNVVIER